MSLPPENSPATARPGRNLRQIPSTSDGEMRNQRAVQGVAHGSK